METLIPTKKERKKERKKQRNKQTKKDRKKDTQKFVNRPKNDRTDRQTLINTCPILSLRSTQVTIVQSTRGTGDIQTDELLAKLSGGPYSNQKLWV